MTVKFTRCPLCEQSDLCEVFVTKDRHYGITGTFHVVRCQVCSLMFLSPMLLDDELSALYPEDYYAYQPSARNHQWKQTLKKLLGVYKRTRDPHFYSPGRVLDLGCGTGWYLEEMRARGWDAYGVEINAKAAEIGRTNFQLNIIHGTLRDARFPSGFFDYIRSNHSFEHISCPGETLDEIHRILSPTGKLLIGVPNVAGLNAKLFRQYWWYLGAPVHPYTYSSGTLTRLLTKHGFVVESVQYNSDYSGILGSAQIWLNRKNGRKSTEGLWFNNPALRLFCHWAARGIDVLRLGDAIEVTAVAAGKAS